MTGRPQRAERNGIIDAMRVGGILYIIAYWHLPSYVSGIPGIGSPPSELMVTLALGSFVFVSGYLLGNTTRSGQWIARFYRRRFYRIYLPFVLASIVFLAMSFENAATFVKSIFLVSMFLPPPPLTLWFVTMIAASYAVAPLLIVASEHPARLWPIAAAIMALLLLYNEAWGLDKRIVLYFPAFVAGVYFARRALPQSTRALAALGALTVLAALPVWFRLTGVEPQYALASLPWATLAPLAVLSAGTRAAGQFRSPPALAVLGEASFFMYLLHRPIYGALVRLWRAPDPLEQAAYMVLIGLPLVVILAVAAHFVMRRLNIHRPPFAASRAA